MPPVLAVAAFVRCRRLWLLLDLGNDEDWFRSNLIVGLAIASAISLVVFPIWELTDRDPIVNLRLFRHRNFSAGTAALVLAYSAFSESASWCRHGCSAILALPPSGRVSPQRPSASCRCTDAVRGPPRAQVRPAHARHAGLRRAVADQLRPRGLNLDVDFDHIAVTAKIGGAAAGGH